MHMYDTIQKQCVCLFIKNLLIYHTFWGGGGRVQLINRGVE